MLNENEVELLAKLYFDQGDSISTEEATKNALVMPLLAMLGYDVFNPMEVVPEYCADVGGRRAEKVDYAIMKDGAPVMLIECKASGEALNTKHAKQLFRYFSATDAGVSILTNGVKYQFFADLEKKNKMDDRPFFEFDITRRDEHQMKELWRFSKTTFCTDTIINSAGVLRDLNNVRQWVASQLDEPGGNLVRLVAKENYNGPLRANVLEQFAALTKRAFNDIIRDRVRNRLEGALAGEGTEAEIQVEPVQEIVTTEEEILGFNIVRAIASSVVSVDTVFMRDARSYCAILFDNNNRKPICRLRFDGRIKKIGIFEGKKEILHELEQIEDIYNHAGAIKAALANYQ